ncbi:MAG: hypothetical protein ACREXR_09950, partial [Gammaproteobacteria bacterium]
PMRFAPIFAGHPVPLTRPPLGSIGIGQLIARIDRSWDTRDEIRAKIGRRLSGLKSRAERTNELLVALLRERSAERIEGEPAEPVGSH